MQASRRQPARSHFAVDSRTIAMAGLMLALVFVMTWLPKIPTPGGGYVHLGDAAIYAAAFLFGPVVGLFAGAVGPALADLAGGYGSWAPGTLVIHGLQGLVAGYLAWRRDWMAMVLAAVIGGVIVVGGYFVYQAFIIAEGVGVAGLSVVPNIVQVTVGGILGIAVVVAVRRAYPPVADFGRPTVWEDRGTV